MTRCLLALGSNLGDRDAILARACAAISRVDGCRLLARSSWHATAAIGGATGQGEFLNGAVLVDTTLEPPVLAASLQKIEADLGRVRVQRWDARTLDIDILLLGEQVINTPELTVPHPRMSFRRFVLEPSAQIAGAMRHPISGWTLAGLLKHLQESPRLVVVTAAEDEYRHRLATHLSQEFSACLSSTVDDLQLPPNLPGNSPAIVTLPWESLEKLAERPAHAEKVAQPALVIAIDPVATDASDRAELPSRGLGPLAKITASDAETILQEATAAVRCVWPDL